MRLIWAWAVSSVSDPRNLPHFLTALFTLALAILAFYAWTESEKTTSALEGQLRAIKADQRPFLWVAVVEQPLFKETPNQVTGQIFWNVQYANYGKGGAYNIKVRRYMKVDEDRYVENKINENTEDSGFAMPPGKIDFFTIGSRQGFGKEYFTNLLTFDEKLGVLIEFSYSNSGRDEIYTDSVCMERLATGAMAYRNPKDCHK